MGEIEGADNRIADRQVSETEQNLARLYRAHLSGAYVDYLARQGLDCVCETASGSTLVDGRGRRFIDFIAGYGVYNLGHNPTPVVEALQEALERPTHHGRPFLHAPLARLAARLAELAPGDLNRVFVCTTGAEAVDTALKFARLATGREEIVAANGSFHGFTLGALSVSGVAAQTRPFEPLLPAVRRVPFGDAAALAAAVSTRTAAVILEPVQAEIGGESPPAGYLAEARAACDASRALLLVDEVRTGMGRTGPLFCIEDEAVIPDVLIIGKALAAGLLPAAAIVARSPSWRRFEMSFAMSASSFAGHELPCIAALATLDMLVDGTILSHGRDVASRLWPRLVALQARHPAVIARISGRGLLIGLHFTSPASAAAAVQRCIANGLLVALAFCNRNCILVEPPLTIASAEIEAGIRTIEDVVASV